MERLLGELMSTVRRLLAALRLPESPLLPIAVLLYIMLSGSVMYYDLKVFTSWSEAASKIGVFSIYKAPELLGYTYRTVYPPLAPLVFLASYSVAQEAARELVTATGSATTLGLLGVLVTGFAVRLLLKLPLIASALALWKLMVERFGRSVSGLILLGPPVLTVIAVYNFDLFMTLFLVAGVIEAGRGRVVRATLYTVIAALFKQPALVALPFILLYTYWAHGARRAVRAAIAAAAVAAAVVAPFAAGSGESFFKWVAGFHGDRPPQGPTLYTAFFTLAGYSLERTTVILKASTVLMAISLLLVLVLWTRKKSTSFWDLVYAVAASLLGVLAFSKVVNPVYTLWAYPFIVAIAAKKGVLRPVAVYLAGSTAVYAWVLLLYLSALVLGKPVYLHEEEKWLQPQEFQSILYASLGPYSPLLDLLLFIGRSSSLVWYAASTIYYNWGWIELGLALLYTGSMLYLYLWALGLLVGRSLFPGRTPGRGFSVRLGAMRTLPRRYSI